MMMRVMIVLARTVRPHLITRMLRKPAPEGHSRNGVKLRRAGPHHAKSLSAVSLNATPRKAAKSAKVDLIAPRPAAAVALLLALGPAGAAPLSAHTPVTARFTYARDVLPILERRCASCHRRGGIGPMSLLTYEEARPWAAAIRAEVLAGRMPPWPAEEGLRFAGERSLSAREIDVFADWTSGGAPEGKAEAKAAAVSQSFAALPGPAPEPEAWGAAGAEELFLRMPAPHALPPGVSEERIEVRLESGLGR